MSAIKAELVDLINNIPDEKLKAIRPLLTMIYEDTIVIEGPIAFDDLDEDEKAAVLQGQAEYERGECIPMEDLL